MKAKDTLLLNNTINQNPILARIAGFGVLRHIFDIGRYFDLRCGDNRDISPTGQ